MSATKEFKVGDTVKMSDIGKKQYQDAKYNPYDLTGVITKVNSIIVKWSNGETNSYDPRHIELVEPKQEQYYTSIPTDVKVGDKFKLVYTKSIGTTSEDMDIKWCSDRGFNIGDIVFLKHNDGSSCPKFENNGKTLYLNWGWLKPVKENVVTTAHLADIPPKTLIGRTTESTDVQQFNIGDEVELIDRASGYQVYADVGSTGKIISIEGEQIKVAFKSSNQSCKACQIKLINNKTTNNNAKSNSNNKSIIFSSITSTISTGSTPRGIVIQSSGEKISLGY